MGPQMMDELKEQAENVGAVVKYGTATRVDFSCHPKKVYIDDKLELTADAVIIATGATAQYLGLDSEQKLMGKGVSACAVCDGFFYKGKDVILVGGGDSACEEALYLSNLCPNVSMLVRKDNMRASKIMQQRVIDKENIKLYWNTETKEVLGDDEVEGVLAFNNKTNEDFTIKGEGFFVAIGHKPNTSIFLDFLDHDDTGYLITQAGNTNTNIEGVFASGDVQDKIYRQAVTAAGTGCMAALDAERYLAELGHN
jgi:thioredoxin reductase (NADPH)